MSEPVHLTYEQFLPLGIALHRREAAMLAGIQIILPPFPNCPTCQQSPTELIVRNDHPAHFLADLTCFGFRPCGHSFTVSGEDLFRAHEHARQEAP